MEEKYIELAVEYLKKLTAIPSPTGYTEEVAEYVRNEFAGMGYDARLTRKGGVFVDMGANRGGEGILLSAHVDTLGAMVKRIKGNGRLLVAPIGGLSPNNTETEFCTVVTKSGKKYSGTFQLANASTHVNLSYNSTARTFDSVEIVLDEDVKSEEDAKALGIRLGDYVCVEPRTVVTESGYIKSRFLDDKLSAAMLLSLGQYVKDKGLVPQRHIYMHFTVFEEVGHGAGMTPPADVTEVLGVDMGCVGDGLACTEHEVSICAKDSFSPSTYSIVCELLKIAEEKGLGCVADIYPGYSSDCDVMVKSYDLKHCLIGAGVYASHGYERSHKDGVRNTMALLEGYLL